MANIFHTFSWPDQWFNKEFTMNSLGEKKTQYSAPMEAGKTANRGNMTIAIAIVTSNCGNVQSFWHQFCSLCLQCYSNDRLYHNVGSIGRLAKLFQWNWAFPKLISSRVTTWQLYIIPRWMVLNFLVKCLMKLFVSLCVNVNIHYVIRYKRKICSIPLEWYSRLLVD